MSQLHGGDLKHRREAADSGPKSAADGMPQPPPMTSCNLPGLISKRAAKADPKAKCSRGQAIVAGAGPAGCVMAMYLARQGFAVKVLENRSDPTTEDARRTTFIMGLGPRGVDPLRELGIRLPDGGWVNGLAPSKGSVLHHLSGGTEVRRGAEGNIFVERAELAKHLLMESRRLHPAVDFESDLDPSYDLQSRTVILQGKNGSSGSTRQLHYDLLVGADGSSSKVREAIEAQVPGFKVDRKFTRRKYFVARDLPAVPGVDPTDDELIGAPGHYLHFFPGKPNMDPTDMPPACGVYSHEDGTQSAALILNKGHMRPADVAAWQAELREALPTLPQVWTDLIAQQTFSQRAHSWGSTINCSQLAVPELGVALVGDAGHGVTPTMGQGCNSALETAAVLSKALETHKNEDLASALVDFNCVRQPEADALAHLDSISGMWWTGSIIVFHINWPRLQTLANLTVSGVLHKLLPFLWDAPAMKVGFTKKTMTYTDIVWCRRRDTAILLCTLMALLLLALASVSWLLLRQ